MQHAHKKRQDAEWVALRAAHSNWGDDVANYVQIVSEGETRFQGDVKEVQGALELLLKSFVPENPTRKHLTIDTQGNEVSFTVSDSLWPLTDEDAPTREMHGSAALGSWLPKLEHRWFAIRHADAVARRYGGRLSLKESNGHLAVTMHLAKA